METLLLKMMLSWAILIIGFVTLFVACNNPKEHNDTVNVHDSVVEAAPDNTRTDGMKDQKVIADSVSTINK
jgi:hypothetical protein